MKWLYSIAASAIIAAPLPAQDEAALKEAFEGRMVTLKLDMPGTQSGVDIYPGSARSLDYPRYATRLKDNGTAIKAGESAMVTKVKLKKSAKTRAMRL